MNAYIIVRDFEARFGRTYEVLHPTHQMTFFHNPRDIDQAKRLYGYKTLREAQARANRYDGNRKGMYILGPRDKKHLIVTTKPKTDISTENALYGLFLQRTGLA